MLFSSLLTVVGNVQKWQFDLVAGDHNGSHHYCPSMPKCCSINESLLIIVLYESRTTHWSTTSSWMRSCSRSNWSRAPVVGTIMVVWLVGPISHDGSYPYSAHSAPECLIRFRPLMARRCHIPRKSTSNKPTQMGVRSGDVPL
ncbi:hypothetical protein AVEN_231054-1 [Araneus ventricosus]|uniref:Uncharacterized protein n=1 Tax=Araneus ventricosus TaxID=182803 RepID=A0A4Y2A3B0_ARAVE|nr:hypothetical protein AVEN_231054-1 [Araneus ventricosus]